MTRFPSGRKGGGASHQRGNAFPRPPGRLYGFRRQRRYKKWRRRRRTSPAQRYYITPEGGSPEPACKAKPITGRTLGAQGQRPGGAINPRPRKRASTFGNTGKHRPIPTAPKAPEPSRPSGLVPKSRQPPFGPGPQSGSFSSTTGTPALTRASASTPWPLIFFPLKVPS